MSALLGSYDPTKYTFSFMGFLLSGFSDGTFVKAERNSRLWTMVVGADGAAVRVKSGDKSGKITLTLLQSSPSNDFLSSQIQTDELTSVVFGTFIAKDASGTTVINAQNCWLAKYPEIGGAKDETPREYEFETNVLNMFAGGNF